MAEGYEPEVGSGTDPDDVPGGELTGTEGQFDAPAGGTE